MVTFDWLERWLTRLLLLRDAACFADSFCSAVRFRTSYDARRTPPGTCTEGILHRCPAVSYRAPRSTGLLFVSTHPSSTKVSDSSAPQPPPAAPPAHTTPSAPPTPTPKQARCLPSSIRSRELSPTAPPVAIARSTQRVSFFLYLCSSLQLVRRAEELWSPQGFLSRFGS